MGTHSKCETNLLVGHNADESWFLRYFSKEITDYTLRLQFYVSIH